MPPIDRISRSALVWLGLLSVACLVCDFFMVPVLTLGPARPALALPLFLASVGCVLAQGCLLAAWLAWSAGPLWPRLARHWIVAAMLYLAWAAGLVVSHPSQAIVCLFVGFLVPFVSIGAQTPLWIARQAFGWRLIRGDPESSAGSAQLSIRDLIIATLLVALALALARLAPSPDGKGLEFVWLIMFAAATTTSTIAMLPAAALLLRMRRFPLGMLLAGLYAAFWMGLPWLVVLVGRHQGLFGGPPWPVLAGVSCLIASFASMVILAAAAARACGYRLTWGRPMHRSAGS